MKYSVIVPVHNEEGSVHLLYEKIRSAMDGQSEAYEILFVDDASTDQTAAIAKAIKPGRPRFTLLRLKNRGGIATALQAGFDAAGGQVFITLDGDLQNDPEDIPAMIRKLGEGYDLVCGWRRKRQDPFFKKCSSRIANLFRRALMREKIHDVGCTLRVFRREVVKNMRLSGGLHRYFTALAVSRGHRITEMEVRHNPRVYGRSKFGTWGRLVEGLADLIRFWRLSRGEK